jgi:DNA-binding transcriptional LysR family regulator
MQLRYVIAIAEEASFTKAAERLRVSPATLSDQVRKLEQELDVLLFQRTTRHVAITPVGERVVSHAREILAAFDSLQEDVDDYRSARRGHVALGRPSHSPVEPLSSILAGLSVRHVGIEIRLVESLPGELIKQVKRGRLDLSLVLWPSRQPPADLNLCQLETSRVGVVVARSHPLAGRESIALGELVNEPFVRWSDGTTNRIIADEVCERASFAPTVAFESRIPEMVCKSVAIGRGIAITSKRRALEFDLSFVPCIPEPQELALGLAWPHGVKLSPSARIVRDDIELNWTSGPGMPVSLPTILSSARTSNT